MMRPGEPTEAANKELLAGVGEEVRGSRNRPLKSQPNRMRQMRKAIEAPQKTPSSLVSTQRQLNQLKTSRNT